MSFFALLNFHLMDEDSSEPTKRRNRCDRHGEYHKVVKEDGTQIYGRFKKEDPDKEKAVLHRLQEVNEVQTLNSKAVTESFIDNFIEKDLPWRLAT